MAKISKIIVNGKTYQVQTLGVLDTLSLHLSVTRSLGAALGKITDVILAMKNKEEVDASELGRVLAEIDPGDIQELQLKTFSQVITPENYFLNDTLSIEKWFSGEGNEGDVWEVFAKALVELLGEYLPNSVKGILQGMKKEVSALKSQSDTQ